MTDEEKAKLMRIIGGTAAGLYEHSSAIMQVIESFNTSSQAEAFGLVLECFRMPSYRSGIEIDGVTISKRRLEELEQSLGGMVDGLLRYIVSTRMSAADAGSELCKLIMARHTDEQKNFCLYYVLIDKSVPYAPIPASTTLISGERWTTLQLELSTEIAKVRTIFAFTENASVGADLLLSVIEAQADREKRVALLAYALTHLARVR